MEGIYKFEFENGEQEIRFDYSVRNKINGEAKYIILN